MRNIIIDGNNMLYRAISRTEKRFKYNPDEPRKNVNGIDVLSIENFFIDLYKSTEEFHQLDTEFYIVWDKKIDTESNNWRNEVNPNYKQNRDQDSPLRHGVNTLCPHIKKISDAWGIKTILPLTSECDDIINHLINVLPETSVIVSTDQDFYQCVNEDVCIFNPIKKLLLTETNFEEHVDVSLKNFVLWKSIMGDTSDNLKGLYRYGKKRSKKFVENLETLASSWEEFVTNSDKLVAPLAKLGNKISKDDIETVTKTKNIIDLNSRPLSSDELYAVNYQLEKNKDKYEKTALSVVMDSYKISGKVSMLWNQFYEMKELSPF